MRKKLKDLNIGCSRTEVFISPKNYKALKAKSIMPKYWFVECRFFDPTFLEQYPSGFQFRKKFSGLDLPSMKFTAEVFKEEMENQLDKLNYNPLTKEYMSDGSCNLYPGLLFIDALEKTHEKLKSVYKTAHHSKQVQWCINRIKKVQYQARVENLRISEIRTHHIKNLLDKMNLTDSVYNKFRTYLMSLFKELAQYGCVESNYIRDISKREENAKVRFILTDRKFDIVFNYLLENLPEFFRYASIFFYSGARSSELMRLKRNDVDFENREFRVLVMKGRKQSWETKAIVPSAVPFWKSLLDESLYDDEFLFSHFQCPGETEISGRAITQKWNRFVKKSDKIKDPEGKPIIVTEDFYSLKHLFLDKLDQLSNNTPILDINLAQGAASHKSDRTTGIYAVGRKNRAVEHLKKISI